MSLIISGNNLFASRAGFLIMIGVMANIVGIAIIGYAGSLKNKICQKWTRGLQ